MRKLHQFYAWFAGYFWLPCPKCGRMFGGHENFYSPPIGEDDRVWYPLHHRNKSTKVTRH